MQIEHLDVQRVILPFGPWGTSVFCSGGILEYSNIAQSVRGQDDRPQEEVRSQALPIITKCGGLGVGQQTHLVSGKIVCHGLTNIEMLYDYILSENIFKKSIGLVKLSLVPSSDSIKISASLAGQLLNVGTYKNI